MRIIEPYVAVPEINSLEILKNIEKAGRVCYKSEDRITDESYKAFIKQVIKNGHESVLEHEKVTVRFICDRGVSHEIVRHRIASYSQESTRYCNYQGGVTFIRPFWVQGWVVGGEPGCFYHWWNSCRQSAESYIELLKGGWTPQQARSVLPNSLKTEIVVTYNLREWRHFFSLRAAKPAHPQMQQLAIPLLLAFKEELAPVFDDIGYNEDFNAVDYAEIKRED